MTELYCISPQSKNPRFEGNLIVSALVLNADQKDKLNKLVVQNNPGVTVDHAKNGLTHIYALNPVGLDTCQINLTHTLKSVLVPNQYARILKLCYGDNATFWTRITDFSATESLFPEQLKSDWIAKIDVDIEDVTDALVQIPKSEQHKILEFSGVTEWRSSTVEEWTGTSLFKITDENLAELKKYFTDLYDWGVGSGDTTIVFHKADLLGETAYAITGLFTDHCTLNEDYIDEHGLEFDDFDGNIQLTDLLKKLASPNQEINITIAGMDSRKCYLFVENHKI